jgi:hypothetical protein
VVNIAKWIFNKKRLISLMQAKPFRITVLNSSSAQALTDLRIRCFRQSPSFSFFDEAALQWTTVDESSVVLGVFTALNELVSTVRIAIRPDRDAVESFLAYSTENVPDRFPAMIAGRAATDRRFTKLGIAAVMRRVILKNAQRLQVASLTGVVYEDAPRVRSMLSHGYEFFDSPKNWDAEATITAKPIIISMPFSAFTNAMNLIEAESSKIISQCEVDEAKITDAFNQDARRNALL